MLSHSMLSDREDAELSLSGKSALVFEAADSRVVALTGQADVLVLTSGFGAVTMVELTIYFWKGSSRLRWLSS